MHESLVRKLREHARWTPEELSRAVGIPLETVVRWDAGTVAPDSASLVALTDACMRRAQEIGAERDWYVRRRLRMTPLERLQDAQRLADESFALRVIVAASSTP